MRRPIFVAIAAIQLLSALSPAHADELVTDRAAAHAPTVPGWAEFVQALAVLPDEMLAKLPPDKRVDPQIQAELGRLMLAALATSSLSVLDGDGDHPSFAPSLGRTLNLARPNADTIYRTAEINPGGTYRLRGHRGSLTRAVIAQNEARGETGHHDINELQTDSDGRFDVILSSERPINYAGAWWQLNPATSTLLLRMVSSDWKGQKDPTISIERLDHPVARPRPSPAELEEALRSLPKSIAFIAGVRMGSVSRLRQQGHLHKFARTNADEPGALAGQFYYETAYELKDDEALIIEVKAPANCGYRSVILTNEMGETIDWVNNHSSLNETQAKPDSDGVLRIVVSDRDPGVLNWLDTAGYSEGGIQGRWTDCSSQPLPNLRKVAWSDILKSVPPRTQIVTRAEREEIIRERRAAFQQRPLW